MDAASPLRLSATAGGVLAIWHDVAPGQAQAVRQWYGREHHFERLAIPGFLQVRRFERVSGNGADILGCYLVEAPAVLRSEGYLARVNAPTDGTRRAMSQFRNMCRTVCAIAAQAGGAEGGHVAALAAETGELADPGKTCLQLMAIPGVLRVTALRNADLEPGPRTAEHRLRGRPDAQIAWALLAEADHADAAEQALQAAQELTSCTDPAQFAVYRLAFAARKGC